MAKDQRHGQWPSAERAELHRHSRGMDTWNYWNRCLFNVWSPDLQDPLLLAKEENIEHGRG